MSRHSGTQIKRAVTLEVAGALAVAPTPPIQACSSCAAASHDEPEAHVVGRPLGQPAGPAAAIHLHAKDGLDTPTAEEVRVHRRVPRAVRPQRRRPHVYLAANVDDEIGTGVIVEPYPRGGGRQEQRHPQQALNLVCRTRPGHPAGWATAAIASDTKRLIAT